MHEFTREETVRWDAWQRANAISALRGARMARLFGIALAATLIAAVMMTA